MHIQKMKKKIIVDETIDDKIIELNKVSTLKNDLNNQPGTGTLYGYKTSNNGSGDDAFKDCLNLALETHRPFIWIYAKDHNKNSNQFANDMNFYQKAFSPVIASYESVLGYFRAKDDGSGPKACKDAYDFFENNVYMKNAGGRKATCNIHEAFLFHYYINIFLRLISRRNLQIQITHTKYFLQLCSTSKFIPPCPDVWFLKNIYNPSGSALVNLETRRNFCLAIPSFL